MVALSTLLVASLVLLADSLFGGGGDALLGSPDALSLLAPLLEAIGLLHASKMLASLRPFRLPPAAGAGGGGPASSVAKKRDAGDIAGDVPPGKKTKPL